MVSKKILVSEIKSILSLVLLQINMAEGFGREGNKDHFLSIAEGSADDCRSQL